MLVHVGVGIMQYSDTKMLTVNELADVLHMNVGTIRNRLSRHEPMPPSVTIGRRRLFPVVDLEQWLKAKVISNDDGFKPSLNPYSNKKDATDE